MKAVMPVALPDVMAWRKHVGADRWDEMWEGVLHMPPPPNVGHQDMEGALEAYLHYRWAPTNGGKVYHQIALTPNAVGWTKNYRVPDLVLLLPERFDARREEFFEGAPDVASKSTAPAMRPTISCRSTPSSARRKSGSSTATRKNRKSTS